MVFADNEDRFLPFKDKIIYVPISLRHFGDKKGLAWVREEYQRNSIKQGILRLNLKDTDLVVISDLDEIPNKDILVSLKNNLESEIDVNKEYKCTSILKIAFYTAKILFYITINKDTNKVRSQLKLIYFTLFKKYTAPLNFKMINYYYYLNYQKKGSYWSGVQCLQARWFKIFTANELRVFRKSPIQSVVNGGWHFSYLGGKDKIKHKIRNFSHQEYNIPEILSDEYIDFCISNGYSLFDYYKNKNSKPQYIRKEVSHLPKDLQDIIVLYQELILK
jgi:beta-1,4-mannosyl-glycoprotein beta-1,4-N-acetylglucosaminyltransferase